MHKTAFPLLLASAGSTLAALQVDFGSTSSTKAAAKDVAFDLMSYYKGNQSGGILGLLDAPPPKGLYYWWTNAIVWSTMLDYWHYTGDDTYNAVTAEALAAQSGPGLENPFLPANWSAKAGNDDHGFWGIAAMQAAEVGLPSPPQGVASWIDLATAVFDKMAARYSAEKHCHGGLRWQLAPLSEAYYIKNTESTAVFLNLGARLFRYTNNETYAEWAERSWNWLSGVGLIDDEFNVYDSTNVADGCTDILGLQWSYGAGVLLQGAAYMQNHTTNSTTQQRWQARLTSLTTQTITHFFPNSTLVERACERPSKTACSWDMVFFKGIALRALASAAQLAPSFGAANHNVTRVLRTTAEAAAKTCDGGERGRACAFRWAGVVEGEEASEWAVGPPVEVNALAAVMGVLVGEARGLATVNETAGGQGGGEGSGSGSGSGSEGGSGDGNSEGAGNGDDGSAGASTRVGMGLVLAGLLAALL
ncbi:glycosyl hydrolase family 76-domain-containing protein [Parachaetomium inaequale]|uniref:Mannan endo-1,6-alpha-mannosidase n=1 Tax=Parachaetomium inaequale TaxID=2588326 RepID=A0AAN6PTB1_9PEZI|nr:glycosyl hydrolase family 76-domain-containing protein [Parachaetomium inaequale]